MHKDSRHQCSRSRTSPLRRDRRAWWTASNTPRRSKTDWSRNNRVRPGVRLDWNNGRLHIECSLNFHASSRPSRARVAGTVRAASPKEFKQTPEKIVSPFHAGSAGHAAQAGQTAY